MTSLLVWKEHMRAFYAKNSMIIQPVLRFLFGLCTYMSLNRALGYMAELANPIVVLVMALVSAALPWGVTVFMAGCLMIAHVYAVSLEMALIALILLLVIATLYYGFKPGDSVLMILTPMAFVLQIPYAIPLLVGLGGSLFSVIPVSCGVFLYYLLLYVKQNAGVLTNDSTVDLVQKYTQIIQSVVFNQTMMVMVVACALGILVVYLIRRLSMDYAWGVAIAAGAVAQLLVIFMGDFLFSVSVPVIPMIFGLAVSCLLAVIYNFFIFSVDYTRTEYVQFEDDDYYYYVKAVPKMTVATPEFKVQKINARKRSVRE
ncbi:MAG: ABC transporter permease [Lachnospiraceae bacterium]|uniref:ABC transporter permease n=1 Tax=Candidatus Enterocloster excrementigallinarum TaxID=2838558 RepID=A0A9D2PY68_9FIRM|nr:ABC transporter permease [Lachnospiraceae bacterium]HJC67952.1 ABC transporter permease [Candidatus Enterocloster excrementigallinarum]